MWGNQRVMDRLHGLGKLIVGLTKSWFALFAAELGMERIYSVNMMGIVVGA